jgi:hypothetical protein
LLARHLLDTSCSVCESVFCCGAWLRERAGDGMNLSTAASGGSTSPAHLILVGVRGFGQVHAERITRLQGQGLVELIAAVDPGVVLDPPTIYGVELYADQAEALTAVVPVDVVIIAAPLGAHFQLATIALRAGADVYLEEPRWPPWTTSGLFSRSSNRLGGRSRFCRPVSTLASLIGRSSGRNASDKVSEAIVSWLASPACRAVKWRSVAMLDSVAAVRARYSEELVTIASAVDRSLIIRSANRCRGSGSRAGGRPRHSS